MNKYEIIYKKIKKLLKNYNYIIKKKHVNGKNIYKMMYNKNSDSYYVCFFKNYNEMFNPGIYDIFSIIYFHTSDFELCLLMDGFLDKSIEERILKLQLMGY